MGNIQASPNSMFNFLIEEISMFLVIARAVNVETVWLEFCKRITHREVMCSMCTS